LGAALAGALALLFVAIDADRAPPRFVWSEGWRADCAIVPSGDPFESRTHAAARLWKAGHVRFIVISGAGFAGDSAEYLAKAAREDGVPAEALLLENDATTTWENALFVRPLLAKISAKRAIVVTERGHGRRVMLAHEANLPGIELKLFESDDAAPSLRLRVREAAALIAYAAMGRIQLRDL
jgi:uncharacterized SAM-binding protein YcdF (DUF218 family)